MPSNSLGFACSRDFKKKSKAQAQLSKSRTLEHAFYQPGRPQNERSRPEAYLSMGCERERAILEAEGLSRG